jgi:spermidine synthase
MMLGLVCFVSGAAALIFETLWFHLTGLAFGNSVWASSLVTASFMAGLALGGGLAARYAWRLANPLRWYAYLEVTIGLAGTGVVLLLPRLTPTLAPLFRRLIEHAGPLNAVRLALALAIMVVPTTAMGATLPLMVMAATKGQVAFGRALGWLYGWNTLGGVAGVLAGEILLIAAFGIQGTAIVATALNACASLACILLSRAIPTQGTLPPVRRTRLPRSLLGAAFLSGMILLGLEVVWFRFLLLFVIGTTLTFALMLAVILVGIGLGGLAASFWLKLDAAADRWLPALATVAGGVTVLTYVNLAPTGVRQAGWGSLVMASQLMFPGAFISGALFTMIGNALRRRTEGDSHAAGSLTLSNTVGAMTGSLLAGFVLLPQLGVERSILGLALAYVVVGAATFHVAGQEGRRGRYPVLLGAAALLAISAALFPFGLLQSRYLKPLVGRDQRIVAFREGIAETVVYIRTDWAGEPHHYQLMTNGVAMSTTKFHAQHYMKLYAYWALAMRPEARHALLVCYGVGNTAKALVDTAGLTSIDVVDISRDVLTLSGVPYPPPSRSPLQDPRVRVHVEDGRFFLLTTALRFDVITAEPPPPKQAGVVNLYSREYFALVHDRLLEGGVATYWLPVDQLQLPEAKSIIRAFCSAFDDCSLWTGGGAQWMLAGTRNGGGPDLEAFTRQWRDARVAAEMRRLAFDVPEMLGAVFIADAGQLQQWVGEAAPVADNWPKHIGPVLRPDLESWKAYVALADADASRARFEQSDWIRRVWPAEMRRRSPAFFLYRQMLDDLMSGQRSVDDMDALRSVVTGTPLYAVPLLLMGIDPAEVSIAEHVHGSGVRDPTIELVLGADALARRDYRSAEERFATSATLASDRGRADRYRSLAAGLSRGN